MPDVRPETLEQAVELAWHTVGHHVDAYMGYPDVQQDILNEEAERIFIESHARRIPGATPVILHLASMAPLAVRAESVEAEVAEKPESHLDIMLGTFDTLLTNDMAAAQLAVDALRHQFSEETIQRRVLERRWRETITRIGRRIGGRALVNQLQIS